MLYVRVFLVVAFTVALKGPVPALLKARTAVKYARLLLKPQSLADVTFPATFSLLDDSSSPPSFQYLTWQTESIKDAEG